MKKFLDKYSIFLWIFVIGSLVGFAHENLLTLFRGHYMLRKGLIYLPLIPIYGGGALLYYIVFKRIKKKEKRNIFLEILMIFLLAFVVGSVFEYLLSYLQEKIWGTVSWHYQKTFNINGRISIKSSTFWGLLGVLFYYFVMPILEKLDKHLKNTPAHIITIIVAILLILDASISITASLRQTARKKGIEAQNAFEEFLDVHYDDELLNHIFNNARKRP